MENFAEKSSPTLTALTGLGQDPHLLVVAEVWCYLGT